MKKNKLMIILCFGGILFSLFETYNLKVSYKYEVDHAKTIVNIDTTISNIEKSEDLSK